MAKSRSVSPRPASGGGSGAADSAWRASAAIQLHLLTETSRLFAAPLSLGRILTKFVALVAGSLDVGSVLLLLREEGESDFFLRAARGVPRGADRGARVACDDSLVGPLSAGGRPLVAPGIAPDLARDSRWRATRLRQLLPAETGSLLVLPLEVRRCLRGVLVLTPPPGARPCTAVDMEWFLPIAEQVSLALEKLTLTKKLEEAGRALEVTVRTRTREVHEANLALRGSLVQIRELRRFSEQVIASLASSLVTFHGAGWVMTANPPARAVLNLGVAPVEGLNLTDLFGAEFATTLLARIMRPSVRITRAQAGIVVRTGEQKTIGYSVTPLLRTHAGRSWILLFRDITDSLRLGSEMRRLDRLVSLGEISANVAHELKNPLTVMYANMEWLLERLPAEFRPRVQITIDHMERMEAIIGRMGILAKDQPLLTRPIDLGDLVAQMLAFVDKTLCEKRIDVVVAVPGTQRWVSGDPAQLQQALLNLIMNAAQAIGDHGTITVRLERRSRGGCRGLELSVADTGPGIPAHLIEKIFQPFFTTKETGTGLGLSITSQIVTAHRGRIRAENLPAGGACVRLWLPEVKPAPATAARD